MVPGKKLPLLAYPALPGLAFAKEQYYCVVVSIYTKIVQGSYIDREESFYYRYIEANFTIDTPQYPY